MVMDARQERGIEIAKQARLRKTPMGGWIVPSQSRGGSIKYAVIIAAGVKPTCTCPDYELRGEPCKHVYAVQHVIQTELFPDGRERVTETVRVTRTTYPQNWPAYNKAQTTEKDHFQMLLRDLCKGIAEPDAAKTGRPRLPTADRVFAAIFKVYSTVPG